MSCDMLADIETIDIVITYELWYHVMNEWQDIQKFNLLSRFDLSLPLSHVTTS